MVDTGIARIKPLLSYAFIIRLEPKMRPVDMPARHSSAAQTGTVIQVASILTGMSKALTIFRDFVSGTEELVNWSLS